jgi:aminopeptidase N
MLSPGHDPIMTNSESVVALGPNAYGKPATALNILRETILGRELFDFSFKEYARRWMFKRPMPADFFRTMEDASGTDLDWFWRGWFYTNQHVDLSLEKLTQYTIDTRNPEIEKPLSKKAREEAPVTLSAQRNKPLRKRTDDYPELLDFYNKWDEFAPLPSEKKAFETYVKTLEEDEQKLLDPTMNFYAIELKNIGGVVMPVILSIEFGDGSKEEMRIPAEIWRRQSNTVTKLIPTRKEIRTITLDPHLETADADLSNNHWPRKPVKSKFQLFKEERDSKRNPMNESKADAAPSSSGSN